MATKTMTKTVGKSAPVKVVKCCLKGCGNEAKSRGLCPNHYQGASKAVAAGKTTWTELVRLGAAKEAKERGPGFLDFVKDLRAKNKAAKAASGGKTKPSGRGRLQSKDRVRKSTKDGTTIHPRPVVNSSGDVPETVQENSSQES